jgi:hypothetical protein
VLGKGGSHAATGAAKAPGGGTKGKPDDMAGTDSGRNRRLPTGDTSIPKPTNRSVRSWQQHVARRLVEPLRTGHPRHGDGFMRITNIGIHKTPLVKKDK